MRDKSESLTVTLKMSNFERKSKFPTLCICDTKGRAPTFGQHIRCGQEKDKMFLSPTKPLLTGLYLLTVLATGQKVSIGKNYIYLKVIG